MAIHFLRSAEDINADCCSEANYELRIMHYELKMYLHLGQDTVVRTGDIVGIFDLDNTTVSARTRGYLKRAQDEKRVVNVSAELPKSFVVCGRGKGEIIYLSQLSPATLLHRAVEGQLKIKN